MYALADETEEILIHKKSDPNRFGRMLGTSWQLKRGVSAEISTDSIDRLYAGAEKAGALGGKLLGADGGNFLLFYVEKERQTAVHAVLLDLLHVPPTFENGGTTVIFYEPESYVAE